MNREGEAFVPLARTTERPVGQRLQPGGLLVRAQDHDERPCCCGRLRTTSKAADRLETVRHVPQPALGGKPLRLLRASRFFVCRTTPSFASGLLEEARETALPQVRPHLLIQDRPLLHLCRGDEANPKELRKCKQTWLGYSGSARLRKASSGLKAAQPDPEARTPKPRRMLHLRRVKFIELMT